MKRLTKSSTNRVFDGVCGGIGEYFDIDPVIIRILWVFIALFGGTGIIAYLVAMVILPREIEKTAAGEGTETCKPMRITNQTWGLVLVVVGGLLLLRFLDPLWHILLGLIPVLGGILLPAILVLLGVYLLARRDQGEPLRIRDADRTFYRDIQRRKLLGVCAGLAGTFDTDPNLVRLIWVLAALASIGFVILGYILLAIFLPVGTPEEA